MRYSKPVLTIVVVLMILSLNFSAAGAQQEPPKVYGIAVAPVPLKPQGAI